MSQLAQRPKYTRAQLSQWLCLIYPKLSQTPSLEDLEADIKQNPLEMLRKLQLWQLAAVPWGNLMLHYSTHHAISLDTETLFDKIVERRMGGYCMENNIFFATVLLSLGYNLYSTGARISSALDDRHKDPAGFGGWSHMVNIVIIRDRKYVVDVGLGTSQAIQPVLLKDGETVLGSHSAQARLLYKCIAPCTDSNQRMWVLEIRDSIILDWTPQYCFSELEFLPQDFTVMNFSTSQSPTSWFRQKLVLTRLILDGEQKEAIGTLTLFGSELKHRERAHSEELVSCETEQERVRVLEKWFEVKLRPDEIRGIQGLPSEIKQPWEEAS